MKNKYTINTLNNIKLSINKPTLIFLKGDLGSGKTTLVKHIINNILKKSCDIVSPTYTYYNKYDDIYHFDLYRLNNYDEFFAIGGEDIFDNNEGIILVEWPEVIEKYYNSNIEITLNKTNIKNQREILINYK